MEIASAGLTFNKAKPLKFLKHKLKGRGVRASVPIKSGEYVCEYKHSSSYPIKEKSSRDAAYDCNNEGSYTLEVQLPGGKWICLDATTNLNCWGRFINHAGPSEANLKMFRPLMVREKWRVAFLSIRDIEANEELTFDYGQQRHCPHWMRRKKVFYCIQL